jgi:Sulfotransferase domain/N-terminal domain of galactosyltransferase
MIAFCTSCKGRAQHIKLTLPKNLSDNPKAKFVLLDYNSPDDLVPFLKDSRLIESGRLAVYSFPWGGPFRMAHAKNMAHRCGLLEGADILVNVDADNYTGEGFTDYLAEQFEDLDEDIFIHSVWPPPPDSVVLKKVMRGCSGRIAVSKRAFLLTGGYDERYADWGPDDKDFTARLQRLGFKAVEIDLKYIESVPHTDRMRFKEYPHARSTAYSAGEPCEVDPDSTIANSGRFGCGIVFKNFDFTKPIMLNPLPTRIFGIGMHKTATTSLHHALEILGYDSAHWKSGEWAKTIFLELRESGRSRTMEQHYALSDLPFPLFYKELDQNYPGSKFILTIRNEDAWLDSVKKHWDPHYNSFRWEWDAFPASNLIHHALYGRRSFDGPTMLERYRRHNAEVIAYFKGRPDDLLVMDMDFGWPKPNDEGAGWPELCGFLGKPIPSVSYPRSFAAY